jgi:Protein SCAI
MMEAYWLATYRKAFKAFTKLWLYQQTNRSNLNLMRWEIGQMACRIAQLYYHY